MKAIVGNTVVCLCLLLSIQLSYGQAGPRRQYSGAQANLNRAGATGQLDWRAALPAPAPSRFDAMAKARLSDAYGKLPLRFEANRGQSDPRVKFLSRGGGHTLFLTSTEAVLALEPPRGSAAGLPRQPAPGIAPQSGSRRRAVLHLKMAGANPAPQIVGREELPGRSNYLTGGDPTRWKLDIPAYGQVEYRDLYPGVNLVFYGNQRQLEYDFIVAAGADPRQIRLAISGAESLQVDAAGDLVLQTAGKEVRFRKPVLYQVAEGGRREIAGRYVLRGRQEVGFDVGAYDASGPLVIDPVLAYSTYLGGAGNDNDLAVAVDSAGNAYVAGSVSPANLPAGGFTPNGAMYDAFVSKLSADGTALLYTTFLAGNNYDQAQAIAVDSEGNACITGFTASVDFPTANSVRHFGGTFDAFVSKLDGKGALLYSTFLGGTGTDVGAGIAVDSAGNAYITGFTSSANFPTVSAKQPAIASTWDAFVTKLSADGSTLIYSTFLGGTAVDQGSAIAVDAAGSAYVTGYTLSTDFPTVNPLQAANGGQADAFVTKLSADGTTLVYSTYLGGGGNPVYAATGNDYGYGIAVDSAGNAYVTGYTNSMVTVFINTTNFPTVNPVQAANAGGYDVFVSKINTAGSALVYSTYLGGSDNDFAYGIAVDGAGKAYVTGFTVSANFPTVNAVQAASGGGTDAFVAALNASGSALFYSTYLGGGGDDFAYGIATDASGNVVVAGYTDSTNFPTVNPLRAANAGVNDGFLARIVQPGVPAINAGGVVNSASYSTQVAAGSIASVFGTGLAVFNRTGTTLPLPTSLGGASVTVNNIAAPLFFVSPTQINFQVPWEVQGQAQLSVQVTTPGGTSNALVLSLAPIGPGLFSLNASGSGQGTIQIANTTILAAPAGSFPGVQARPANRGEFVSIFCTGLGPVSNRPATGAPGGNNPLSATPATPAVTIGGLAATVNFSGLAPGLVGLYQVNAQVPANVQVGSAVPVTLTINGVVSIVVTLAIQ